MCTSFCRFAFEQPAGGNNRSTCSPASQCPPHPLLSFSIGASFCTAENRSCACFRSRFGRRNLPVADFRELWPVRRRVRISVLSALELFDLLLELADFPDSFLFLPARRAFSARLESSFSTANSFFNLLAAAPSSARRFLSAEPGVRSPAGMMRRFDLVNLHGQGIDPAFADSPLASSIRSMALSGRKAVRDVAIGGAWRLQESRHPLMRHPVVHFVALFQSAQNRDGVLRRWGSLDEYRLEPALPALDLFRCASCIR